MEMEVHHVHASGKKENNFKHRLFDFFMLFLAVTAGFFVNNWREKISAHEREKEFIHSIAEDLNQDIHVLDSIINTRMTKGQMMDSLFKLLHAPDIAEHGSELYYFTRWSPRTYRFYTHDRTMLQLKSSGNWLLIRNKKVSAALQSYDESVRSLTVYIEQREESLVQIIYPSINKLFDAQVFESMQNGLSFKAPAGNPKLLTYDKATLNEFSNQLHFLKNSNFYFITVGKKLLSISNQTLDLLKTEYHLE